MKWNLTAVCLLGLAGGLAGRAQGLEGSYTGSYFRTDGAGAGDLMRHRYDVGTTRMLPRDMRLNVHLSLAYQSRPGEPRTDLLHSRFFGDVRGSIWRLEAQFAPSQRTQPRPASPRENGVHVAFNLSPRNAPQLTLELNRVNRDQLTSRSGSEDRRAQVSYAVRGLGSQLSYRRIDTQTTGTIGVGSRTQEWRGGLSASRAWQRANVQAVYDALYSSYEMRERRRHQQAHNLGTNLGWDPSRKLTVSGSSLLRWGSSRDNALPTMQDLSERSLGGRIQWRPVGGLDVQAVREYRLQNAAGGNLVSDYLQLESVYRRPITHRVNLQSGYVRTFDLRRHGNTPDNSVYGLLDTRLHPGIQGRAELRIANASGPLSTGTQWHRMLQSRLSPTRRTRLEITWTKDTLPEIEAQAQRERSWDILAGYQPVGSANVSFSWRRLDGRGRIERAERFSAATASWSPTRRSSLSLNWSRRTAHLLLSESRETVAGGDLQLELRGQWRAHGSWREQTRSGVKPSRSYGLSLEKTF